MNLLFHTLFVRTRKVRGVRAATFLGLSVLLTGTGFFAGRSGAMEKTNETIELPAPRQDSEYSLERALRVRRSVREFRDDPITLAQLSQLLWAAQGITDSRGLRTAPSAGALYPLEVYILVGAVAGLPEGTYKYQVNGHKLLRLSNEDRRRQMERTARDQDWVRRNAALIVFAAVEARTTGKYGRRGIRYIHIEVGHAAQNVMLQAQAIGLAAAVVGAFDDDRVEDLLDMPGNEQALYLMPIGKPR
jgi:SagB-type dehydrogenase family enzyme